MPRYSLSFLAHAVTILLGAFLLFLIQPIVAKELLPAYGGSAGVWLTCMLFFQVCVLLGYGYAHILTSVVGPGAQTRLHLAIIALSIANLFLGRNSGLAETLPPVVGVIVELLLRVGLPAIVLAANSPLMQYLRHQSGSNSPYRLYAISNIGSLAALLAYPFSIEAWISLSTQQVAWGCAYTVFAIAAASCWLSTPRASALEDSAKIRSPQLLWLFQAFAGSAVLLAVTNFILQDVASVPLLWIPPLVLYLLSFTLCFDSDRWYKRALYRRLLLAVLALSIVLSQTTSVSGYPALLAACLLGLFLCCMICHGELAALRPPAQLLTRYYLIIALGGALGGIFVTVIAPMAFSYLGELPVALTCCLAVGILGSGMQQAQSSGRMGMAPRLLALAVVLIGLSVIPLSDASQWRSNIIFSGRNFYGTLRIVDDGAGSAARRMLLHGRIIHGLQFKEPGKRALPTVYFGPTSGAGQALHRFDRDSGRRIAIIGLGAGVLVAYGRSQDSFYYFEINPQAITASQEYFTFLKDTPAKVELIERDGRLGLHEHLGPPFDMIIIDAFSGDAVPIHLLTSEAVAEYLDRLAPDGLLVFQVSNLFLDLAPIAARIAEYRGLVWAEVNSGGDPEYAGLPSTYVLAARSAGTLRQIGFEPQSLESLAPHRRAPLWTDDYSNIWTAFR